MMRETMVWFLLATVAFGATSGCGPDERSTGSNTNWLTTCETESDCPSKSECWCHVCTKACGSSADCHGGTCEATTAVGCGEPSSNTEVCIVECTTSAECKRRGSALECSNGACVAASAGGASAAGGATGDEAGSGNSIGGQQDASGPGGNGGGATSGGMGGSAASEAAGQAGESPLGPLEPVSSRIALSADHSCVVSQSKVYCWGTNSYGENGVTPSPHSPIQAVPDVDAAIGVAVSSGHACAFTSSGDVYCWGRNSDGQVGPTSAPGGTCLYQNSPDQPCQPHATHIDGVNRVVELALTSTASCALIDDGTVSCWGSYEQDWPGQVSGATSITSGSSGLCAVVAGGRLTCSYAPPQFDNLTQIRGLALNNGIVPTPDDFGCALGPNGEVSCSGDDRRGQLGDGMGASMNALPSGMKSLVAGNLHVCALDADGGAWCWGANNDGAAGIYPLASFNCSGTCEPSPHLVEGVPALVEIGAGGDSTCGFAADETLWCWGMDSSGASLGGMPVQMPGPWESGGTVCSSAIASIQSARSMLTYCNTDADCVLVPLDVSCDHTCEYASVPGAESDAFVATLNQLESDTCGAARNAGCLSPPVVCPDEQLRAVCINGSCLIDNPERNGCTNECLCSIQRARTPVYFSPPCEAYELEIVGSGTCDTCDGAGTYVVIGNEGGSRFDGHATLSFSPGGATSVPAPMDLDLSLAPGEVTGLIRVQNTSLGSIQATVTADENCHTLTDAITLIFPDPSSCQ